MDQIKTTVLKSITEKQQRIKQITDELQNPWGYLESNSEAYQLHAICVHDGGADGGHYFTFIKDHKENKWRKFNDFKIWEVEESEVFE